MHALSHSLPHRGPSASRARARWQPYASNITLSSTATGPSRFPPTYLNTPASSVASTSPSTVYINPICEAERLKCSSQSSVSNPLRDSQKARYVTRLVDQAVQCLCEIWHPDDIPAAFTCGRNALCAQPASSPQAAAPVIQQKLFATRNTQLPSPVTPSIHPSPPSPLSDAGDSTGSASDLASGCNLVPIKGFVHEVLRRSRTSTGVLQTALCYLEAVRGKIPELIRKEKTTPTTSDCVQEDAACRIIRGELSHDEMLGCDVMEGGRLNMEPTVSHIVDIPYSHLPPSPQSFESQRDPANLPSAKTQVPLPPLPPLPSPLLCPRRAFLACLILASKFMQDRSYSNRAWAKLAGLPPREIGRCERALGEALEWRLWVGKGTIASSTSTSGTSSGRPVTRSRSEGDLLQSSPPCTSTAARAAAWSDVAAGAERPPPLSRWPLTVPQAAVTVPMLAPTPRKRTGLQRSATVPVISAEYGQDAYRPSKSSNAAVDDRMDLLRQAKLPSLAAFDASLLDIDFAQQGLVVSPSMSTPTLSSSPMSSASSSSDGCGDRTIQMATFSDLLTPSPAPFYVPFSYPWDTSGSARFNSGAKTFEADVMKMPDEFATMGLKLAAIDPVVASGAPPSLPPFAETFLSAASCNGMYSYGTA
ncbi:hypothetical protein A0H81_11726 [Grifola frondosa]|uniref:G1/S-specific cyclin pas1 n=1 Tax=Grifola frondosa TaxID=5627 RepID=A0A1C7LU39_GRIFR|nr:hypothetical protein A0H81_11726 [Grifola frondosa]